MAKKVFENPGNDTPELPSAFLKAFRAGVAAAGYTIVKWKDGRAVLADSSGKEVGSFGLDNLRRRLAQEDPAGWVEEIREYVQRVGGGLSAAGDVPPLGEVLERLRPVIREASTDARMMKEVWHRALGETGLWLHLVVDFPDTFAYVKNSQVEESGRSAEELLAAAVDNLRKETPEGAAHLIDEEVGVYLIAVGDSYDPGRSLLLEELLPPSPAGYLVALPNRDRLFVQPVEMRYVAHLHLLRVLAEKPHKEGAYPISDEVFWVHQGQWRPFPIEVKDKNVVVRPPEEFIGVLNLLSAGEGGEEEEGEWEVEEEWEGGEEGEEDETDE